MGQLQDALNRARETEENKPDPEINNSSGDNLSDDDVDLEALEKSKEKNASSNEEGVLGKIPIKKYAQSLVRNSLSAMFPVVGAGERLLSGITGFDIFEMVFSGKMRPEGYKANLTDFTRSDNVIVNSIAPLAHGISCFTNNRKLQIGASSLYGVIPMIQNLIAKRGIFEFEEGKNDIVQGLMNFIPLLGEILRPYINIEAINGQFKTVIEDAKNNPNYLAYAKGGRGSNVKYPNQW